LVGDLSAKHVARAQAVKLAALEGQYDTERGAPLRIGGLPDSDAGVTRGAFEVPHGLSLLAFDDPDAAVKGLKALAPPEAWPPVAKVHAAFQVMVATGSLMALLALLTLWLRWRTKAWPGGQRWWRAWLWMGPLGLVALEAGWLVTEWGRQPWVVLGALRTSE